MNQEKIEKQTFHYPLIFRIIFRFGNFFITLILIFYSAPLINSISRNVIFIFPLIINFLIVYFLNKHYFNLYKILPYNIEADDEKLVCSDFLFSKKVVTIYYKNISLLKGGTFDNKLSGIIKVCDEENNLCIGFYHRLNNSSKLVTIILSKVRRELYDNVLEKIKSRKRDTKK